MRGLKSGKGLQGVAHKRRRERKVYQVQPHLEIVVEFVRICRRIRCVFELSRNGYTMSQAFFEQPKIKSVDGLKVDQFLLGILAQRLLLHFNKNFMSCK